MATQPALQLSRRELKELNSIVSRLSISSAVSDPEYLDMEIDEPGKDPPFRFFELPRELRDEIYRRCTAPLDRSNGPEGVGRITSPAFCRFNLLFTSRQFSREYVGEILRNPQVSLVVDLRPASGVPIGPLYARGVLSRISHVGVCIAEYRLLPASSVGSLYNDAVQKAVYLWPSITHVALTLRAFHHPPFSNRFGPGKLVAYCHLPVTVYNVQQQLVSVEKNIQVSSALYGVNDKVIEDSMVGDYLLHYELNHIHYSASPSTRANSWEGVELETISAGEFDFKAAVADTKKRKRILREQAPCMLDGGYDLDEYSRVKIANARTADLSGTITRVYARVRLRWIRDLLQRIQEEADMYQEIRRGV